MPTKKMIISSKLKYGIKLVSSGLRKHDVGKPIDTYRKASIFWTRNPKLVNPMKEKRIWVQVAKNFRANYKINRGRRPKKNCLISMSQLF